MKRFHASILATIGLAGPALAYDIPWFNADSGGSATAAVGGLYRLEGSIGQCDAGVAMSGTWSLSGGYWTAGTAGGGACPGDINGDNVVDLSDLGEVLAAFNACQGDLNYSEKIDLNGDGCIELSDLGEVLAQFGVPCN